MARWHVVVVLHIVMYWNDTVLVPFDLFKNMICLNFGQNLDHGLLEASPSHQRRVVGRCKSFLTNLDFLDRLHAVANLIIDLVHKVSNSVTSSTGSFGRGASSLEDQDVSFLSIVDLVEYLDAGSS